MSRGRIRDPGFLAFLRKQPCCCGCGRPAPSEAAHIRYSDAAHGKLNPGIQQKPSDHDAVPLSAWCHREGPQAQHAGSERAFWERVGRNPWRLAEAFLAAYRADGGAIVLAVGPPSRKPRPRPKKVGPKRQWQSRPFPRGRGFDRWA